MAWAQGRSGMSGVPKGPGSPGRTERCTRGLLPRMADERQRRLENLPPELTRLPTPAERGQH